MLIDSHCHLHLIDLSDFNQDLNAVIEAAKANEVRHFLSVSVSLRDYPILCKLAEQYPEVNISVGLHPNEEEDEILSVESLCRKAEHPSCIAIGETGLDYYRELDDKMQEGQRERFRIQIHAALATQKPLIIHTRAALEDTLKVMKEENAGDIGGVMHCFSEDWAAAKRAMDLNFYISLSGILTFKNATNVHELAKKVPLDRLLIETDAPFLAPVPFRGKQNHPALLKHSALALAELRSISYEQLAEETSQNFYDCFRIKPLVLL